MGHPSFRSRLIRPGAFPTSAGIAGASGDMFGLDQDLLTCCITRCFTPHANVTNVGGATHVDPGREPDTMNRGWLKALDETPDLLLHPPTQQASHSVCLHPTASGNEFLSVHQTFNNIH